MSLISLPPFSQIRPPRNTPCAPDALILTASASYDDALPSHAVKPTTLMPSFAAALRKLRRDAEAVGLLVVQDEHLLDAERLREHRVSSALVVVRRHDTRVVALAGRVVLARLTGDRARTRVGQADVGVRRADHRDRAVRRAVEDRNLDLGRTGVEGPDHGADARVLRVGVRVRRGLARVPLAGLCRRVIAALVGDASTCPPSSHAG